MRASPNLGLWFDCSRCELYAQCGGSDTGPCGCIYNGTPREYDCGNCTLHCRERRSPSIPGLGSGFQEELRAGRPLDAVIPNGLPAPDLPLLIPTHTDKLDAGTELDVGWFGIQLLSLLTVRDDGSGRPQAWLTKERLQRAQRVSSSAKPIVVLHGDDRLLRAFWGIDRPNFYQMLCDVGVEVVTGPTFSVFDDSPRWPASTSVMMLLHHNRILEELYRYGFVAAPNIFCRSGLDKRNWIAWLIEHPEVTLLSRDFSCTPIASGYLPELRELTEIIDAVGRQFHILLQGIGIAKAAQTIATFESVGATCSLMTGHPHLLGRGGEAITRLQDGLSRRRSLSLSRGELGLQNLGVFEDWLLERVDGSSLYAGRSWANVPSD